MLYGLLHVGRSDRWEHDQSSRTRPAAFYDPFGRLLLHCNGSGFVANVCFAVRIQPDFAAQFPQSATKRSFSL